MCSLLSSMILKFYCNFTQKCQLYSNKLEETYKLAYLWRGGGSPQGPLEIHKTNIICKKKLSYQRKLLPFNLNKKSCRMPWGLLLTKNQLNIRLHHWGRDGALQGFICFYRATDLPSHLTPAITLLGHLQRTAIRRLLYRVATD